MKNTVIKLMKLMHSSGKGTKNYIRYKAYMNIVLFAKV